MWEGAGEDHELPKAYCIWGVHTLFVSSNSLSIRKKREAFWDTFLSLVPKGKQSLVLFLFCPLAETPPHPPGGLYPHSHKERSKAATFSYPSVLPVPESGLTSPHGSCLWDSLTCWQASSSEVAMVLTQEGAEACQPSVLNAFIWGSEVFQVHFILAWNFKTAWVQFSVRQRWQDAVTTTEHDIISKLCFMSTQISALSCKVVFLAFEIYIIISHVHYKSYYWRWRSLFFFSLSSLFCSECLS